MSSIGVRLVEVMFVLLACLFVNTANADVSTKNLASEIEAGNVSVSGVEGTGGSSGTVLDCATSFL